MDTSSSKQKTPNAGGKEQSEKKKFVEPLIATIIAAIVLVLLFIPGVLVFPEDLQGPTQKDIDFADKANEVLRQRVDDLREALDSDICIGDGQFSSPTGELPENIRRALPGPPLSKLFPDENAQKNIPFFNGSVSDLVEESTVFVRIVFPDGTHGLGSGVFVSPSLVVTNAHVLGTRSDGTILVYNAAMGAQPAKIIAKGTFSSEQSIDLAVLEVQNSSANQAYLTLADPRGGQRVTAAGFPMIVMGQDAKFMDWVRNPNAPDPIKVPFRDQGSLNLVQIEKGNIQWIYHTATIDKGNSGGPLIDDCGYLVGINTGAIARETEGVGDITTSFFRAIGRNTIEQFFVDNSLPGLSMHNNSCVQRS